MRTKKVKSFGRFHAGYGTKVRSRIIKVEKLQRKKQVCIFCKKKTAKRISKGLWQCKKCGKKFASHAYYLSN